MAQRKSKKITARQACNRLGVSPDTVDAWIKAGCPTAGKRRTGQKGRPATLFDEAKLRKWVEQTGRKPRGVEGDAIRGGKDDGDRAQSEKQGSGTSVLNDLGMAGYIERVRREERYLAHRFIALSKSDAPGGDIAAVSRAAAQKGEELRRAEMAYLEHRKATAELCDLADMQRLFVGLASAVRERIMSLPNELAPVLRDYLANEDDAGKVRDEIDNAIRHALSALPEELPEVKE